MVSAYETEARDFLMRIQRPRSKSTLARQRKTKSLLGLYQKHRYRRGYARYILGFHI